MSKKVLIIEDNNDIRENIGEILELAGYTVFMAENGKKGVDIAIKNIPDIILCDIMMPELDGYGVLFMLNKHPQMATVPFIFLTAKAERLDLRKGMEMGADDYLTKPFDDIELLNAIESRLKKQESVHHFYSKSLDRLHSLFAKNDGLAELQKVISERKTRQFKKNQVIYYEGDKGYGLYLVISGKIKTIKQVDDGRALMTGMYVNDDYLGIHAILSSVPYADTATALEDSVLCMIPKENLDELLNKYPDVARGFIKVLANDIKEKEEQLLQLAYHSVRKKLSESILRIHRQQSNTDMSFKISREDLAAMAGMATETVSRTLADFKDDGLIDKKGGTITILDLHRLETMKN